MSYYKRRRYYRGRRNYTVKRRIAPTRWQNYGTGLKQLASDVSKLKNMVNVEFKNHDVDISATYIDVTADIQALNYVNQGDGTESRDGSMFRMKSLECRYMTQLQTNMTNPSYIRAIIFLDTDPDGSTPTLASLLDNTTTPYVSPRNLDNRSRYVILYDKLHSLNPSGTEGVMRKIYKSLDLKVLITGATASAANTKKNGLYSCFLSSEASGATYKPSYTLSCRIRYIDN